MNIFINKLSHKLKFIRCLGCVGRPVSVDRPVAIELGAGPSGWCGDAEHPTGITMSRVRLASDTCDLYFSYIKVNLLLYTCSLDPFEDGILLDTPLVCMHRYCRSFTNDEEEFKRQVTPTPSVREAWKQRRKKKELQSLQ